MSLPKTITIGSGSAHPLQVNRLGYGTMRLTGPGIYGDPPNRAEALQILRRTAEAGVNFLDTADYYGEDVTNRLIVEALYPYSSDLVVCTKVGATRKPDKSWIPFQRPKQIRTSVENNLRTLRLDQLSVVHFRVVDESPIPFEASIETMLELQSEGKILHVGLSNVSPNQLEKAMTMGRIATVENMYGYVQRVTYKTPFGINRGGEEVRALCELNKLPLIPYFSLFLSLPKKDNRVALIAKKYETTEAQILIAWLLHQSAWILPIPGTSSLSHFEENLKAGDLNLSQEDLEFLS